MSPAASLFQDPARLTSAATARMDDALSLSRDTVQAAVQSGTILARGWQDLFTSVMGFTRNSIEDAFAHSKATTSVKSIHELVALNQAFARNGLEKAVSESTRLSGLSASIARDAAAPLNSRLDQAVSTLMKPLA